jgi:hypothetical protein
MDTQQAFDLVIQHLWNQNRTSRRDWREAEGCAYRGTGGARCAIGALIPDDLYRDDMEGLSSRMLLDQHPEVAGIPALRALCVEDQHGKPLHELLQNLHDDYDENRDPNFRGYLLADASNIARRFNLVVNTPED